MTLDVQTPRRSMRYQPLVAGPSNTKREQTSTVTFVGNAICARQSAADDLNTEDDVDLREEERSQTTFFASFRRSSSQKASSRKSTSSDKTNDGEFHVGNTVLVKTESRLPSIGVIVSMWEVRLDNDDEGERKYQKVKIHWFLRPNELATVRAKRKYLENEIYFSLSTTAVLRPDAILRHCTVRSTATDDGSKKIVPPDNFCCLCAIDAMKGLFYRINWEEHRKNALSHGDSAADMWEIAVQVGNIRRKVSLQESEDEIDSEDEYVAKPEDDVDSQVSDGEESPEEQSDAEVEDIEDDAPKTPSRKRKRNAAPTTPRKKPSRATIAKPTPHSKRALKARTKSKRGKFKPAPQTAYGFMGASKVTLPANAWLRVMQVLHVGARPDVLPCREKEYGQIMRAVEGLLEEGSGGCVYVSGVPGTGKTATVHRIVRELKRMAEKNEANPFTYIEINGLKIPEASAAYSLLWEAVSGHDVAAEGHLSISAKESLRQLTKYFSAGGRQGPGGHACIVLMDELDQLLTTKQEVVYNFFNWPTLVGSKLIVIAVANTHDLPERVMTGRVRSRLGMTRINYEPYKKPQLVEIVNARLDAAKEGYKGTFPEVLTTDSIGFAAAKVASISGDARRVLDICRRAVELVRPLSKPAKIADVKEVITRMQSSITALYLGDCSLHERIMLAALVKCVLKSGVMEVAWGDVQHQHIIFTPVLAGHGESTKVPNAIELRRVLDSLLATHAVLVEDASVGAAARKAEEDRKLMLNFEQAEVQRVLGDMGGHIWKRALGL